MGEREFVAMLAMLQVLAINSKLPALGVMAQNLGVDDGNRRQLVIGASLVGSDLDAPLPDAISDRLGQRPARRACCAIPSTDLAHGQTMAP